MSAVSIRCVRSLSPSAWSAPPKAELPWKTTKLRPMTTKSTPAASQESVSRALGRWEREDMVRSGRRSVEIREEDRLSAVARS